MKSHRQRVHRRRGPQPMRRRHRDRLRSALRTVVVLTLIFALTGGLVAGSICLWNFTHRSEQFLLREVVIEGVATATESEMRALIADLVEGEQTLFTVSPRELSVRLTEHPRLDPASLRVRRRWPGTIAVEATERHPVAVVVGTRLMLIDGEGWLIEQSPAAVAETDLPLLTGLDESDLVCGDRLTDASAQRLLEWLAALRFHLPQTHRRLSELHVDPMAAVTAHLLGDTVVRLGDLDPIEQMPVLLTFTREIESDLTSLALLDLRMEDHLIYRRHSAAVEGS